MSTARNIRSEEFHLLTRNYGIHKRRKEPPRKSCPTETSANTSYGKANLQQFGTHPNDEEDMQLGINVPTRNTDGIPPTRAHRINPRGAAG
jgi:hypothetical protein